MVLHGAIERVAVYIAFLFSNSQDGVEFLGESQR